MARIAHITEGTKPGLGRVTCQFRNRCRRGCPFGAYFSSNSSTLPAAEATGNMTLRPFSIAHEILYDENKKRATGIKIIDAETNMTYEFKAKVIFLCASTVGSTSILLQSRSNRFPNGMGNDSGELGHNLMDHHFKAGANGKYEGFEDRYYTGRRPSGINIPKFRNIGGSTTQKDFLEVRYQGGLVGEIGLRLLLSFHTEKLKDACFGPWWMENGSNSFGEILPYHDNKMYLDYDKKDKWGLPTVTFDAKIKENELNMRKDMKIQAAEMLESAGFKDVKTTDNSISWIGNS